MLCRILKCQQHQIGFLAFVDEWMSCKNQWYMCLNLHQCEFEVQCPGMIKIKEKQIYISSKVNEAWNELKIEANLDVFVLIL